MKKLVLVLSLFFNVLLVAVCVYQMSRPKPKVKDMKMVHYFSLQDRMLVQEGDVVFLGGERMALCNWMELTGNCQVRNRALPGNTVERELHRIDDVLNANPSKLVLQFGFDDMAGGLAVDTFVSDYEKLIGHIKENSPQTEILVMSLLPIDEVYSKSLYPDMTNDMVSEMNGRIKKLTEEAGVTFVNINSEFLDSKTGALDAVYTTGDGFHLNSNAYFIWKDRIVSFF
ncbi:MAG: GDSL-type esterase/lipase family protein [Paludibacteraceae bacterium]